MKSASNGGILNGSLQVLHIHVLLVAPLGACYMAQPSTDQHQSRVAVRETAYYPSAAADLPVQPLNHIIGTDASPVLAGKIAVPPCSKTTYHKRMEKATTIFVSLQFNCIQVSEVVFVEHRPK